jgi:hypothetical protein
MRATLETVDLVKQIAHSNVTWIEQNSEPENILFSRTDSLQTGT